VDQPVSNRPKVRKKKLTAWEAFYAVDMGIACALSYAIITQVLVRFVDEANKLLGGMWAVAATVFVFRESRASTLSAGIARLIATCVSFALCLVYLLIFPVTGPGIAVVIGLGVNGPRNLPSLGRAKFPTLAGVVISRWFDRFLRFLAAGRGAWEVTGSTAAG